MRKLVSNPIRLDPLEEKLTKEPGSTTRSLARTSNVHLSGY